jgi:thymidylate kinase
MKQPKIYFITGVNTAGKSTMVPLLKKNLSSYFDIHDFDERGVPDNVDGKWRQKETKYWLRVGIRNIKKEISTIVCGLSLPEEIFKVSKSKKIKIAFLDVSAKEISKRLRKRHNTPAKLRALKRVTQLTLAECIRDNIAHAKELRKQCKKYKCKVFNTSKTKPDKTVIKIIKWIK